MTDFQTFPCQLPYISFMRRQRAQKQRNNGSASSFIVIRLLAPNWMLVHSFVWRDRHFFLRNLFAQTFGQPLLFGTTRPDTRLSQSRAGGHGLYLRPLYHFGRSSEAKERKNQKKSKV